jgi:excisionase family DNA binding protein
MTMNAREWDDQPGERMLSVPEAARALDMSESTIWRWIRSGLLPAQRIGPKRVRVLEADVRATAQPARPAAPELTEEEATRLLKAFEDARRFRQRLLEERGGVPFRSSAEDLYELREERSAQLS